MGIALAFCLSGKAKAQIIQEVLLEKDSLLTEPESVEEDLPIDSTITIDGVQLLEEFLRDTVPAPQDPVTVVKQKEKKAPVESQSVIHFKAFLQRFRNQYQSFMERWDDIYLPAPKYIRSNPDYYKLCMPATYYEAPFYQAVSIDDWKPVIPFVKEDTLRKMIEQLPDLERSKNIDRQLNRQLLSFYLTYPQLVKKNEAQLRGLEPLANTMVPTQPKKEKVFDLLTPTSLVTKMEEKDLLVVKPNFWTIVGKSDLQFSQNYLSDNWYKGGESTNSLFAQVEWQFNYDDRQNIQFENKIEWKLGFISTPSDTVHSYRANNDLLRLSSKLGVKAFKNWYYTLSGEFKTQLSSSYVTNSNDLISTFFSPAELNIGLGMDFKYVKNGVLNLSVLINPANYTRYSVASNKVDPTKFNIEEGHKVKNQIGSRIESTLKWKLMQNLTWESRFSYITDYKKVQSEWENTFSFAFNRYFSTKLFIHGRFDDAVAREEGDSYFQLQEQLSLGLSYTW